MCGTSRMKINYCISIIRNDYKLFTVKYYVDKKQSGSTLLQLALVSTYMVKAQIPYKARPCTRVFTRCTMLLSSTAEMARISS